jgi:hypothetical protein
MMNRARFTSYEPYDMNAYHYDLWHDHIFPNMLLSNVVLSFAPATFYDDNEFITR